MKKYILLAVLLGFLPLTSHAALMGFLDGQYYDQSGTLQWICFGDNNCIDKDNNQSTREKLGIGVPPKVTDAPISSPAQTVYVPVPSSPSNQPLATGGAPAVSQSVQKVIFSGFDLDINSPRAVGDNSDVCTGNLEAQFHKSVLCVVLPSSLSKETTGVATLTSKSLGYFQINTVPYLYKASSNVAVYQFTNLKSANDYVLTFTIDSPTASGTATSSNLTIW